MEGQETLVDWGVKAVEGDKNSGTLEKVETLIELYQPTIVILEDASAKGSRRSARIRELMQKIIAMAATLSVKAEVLSREQVRKVFFAEGLGSKHAVAAILAKRFPEELGDRLPPKRRPWMSEDSRMDIYDAVALAVTLKNWNKKAIRS